MISRKKKIILAQSFLLFAGLIILLFTYLNFNNKSSNKIFSKKIKSEIDKKINSESEEGNIFYDIEYSGLDLSGNRYILRAKQAKNNDDEEGVLDLKLVKAFFYFKNDKELVITSDTGIYNNKNLDMTFQKNVNGEYDGSTLQAEKAEYFNSKNLLIVTKNVKIKDIRGTMLAEKLIFDIKKNTLDISSNDNTKVDANINYK